MSMKISLKQLKTDPKKIGHTKDGDLIQLLTKGGFNVIIQKGEKENKIVAMAPHLGIAKQIVLNEAKDAVFYELSKMEQEFFKHLVPVYAELTNKVVNKI